MKRLILAGALLLQLATPASADPSPGVQWLMRDPLNLFDCGMYQASKAMDEVEANLKESSAWTGFPNDAEYVFSWAGYNFSHNKIVLGSIIQAANPESLTDDFCRAALRSIRYYACAKSLFWPI